MGTAKMKSYAVRMTGVSPVVMSHTIGIYRDAVRYLTDISFLHYDDIKDLASKEARQYIERLVHGTKNRAARYKEFDRRFYKMPSYLMRSAITTANAKADSYKKLVTLWETGGCVGAEPRMDFRQDMMPCFYRDNMFAEKDGSFAIKVYKNHDWVWQPVRLKASDVRYLQAHGGISAACAPVLEKRRHGYSLRFAYPDRMHGGAPKYTEDIKCSLALGVDLGINNDAVCSAVTKDGTVTGSKFINSPVEKDRLNTLLNVTRRAHKYGSVKMPRLWAYINNYNRQIAVNTAHGIVSYAAESGARVIVFENLTNIKPKGGKRQKMALWRKRDIQRRTEAMARRYGIRVAYVCPYNTSRLAFDGSGTVTRDKDNHSLCTFATGKRYNCDLSASKNIAARYFIRCWDKIIKTLPETEGLRITAKVPGIRTRTKCTLSTLISLSAVMSA